MRHQVWFGNIEFGEFIKGNDHFNCAIVHKIQAKLFMDESEADDFMVENHYDAYLIPKIYNGEIYYDKGAA